MTSLHPQTADFRILTATFFKEIFKIKSQYFSVFNSYEWAIFPTQLISPGWNSILKVSQYPLVSYEKSTTTKAYMEGMDVDPLQIQLFTQEEFNTKWKPLATNSETEVNFNNLSTSELRVWYLVELVKQVEFSLLAMNDNDDTIVGKNISSVIKFDKVIRFGKSIKFSYQEGKSDV